MKFAKDGVPTIAYLALAAALFAFVSPVPSAVLVVAAGFAAWFYRDPDRTPPEEEDVLVSPADGRVVEIEDATHPFTGPAVKAGIFMNAFSVHVNRTPCEGTVEYLEYVPGKKIAAFAPKASEVNERHYVGLATPCGPVLLVQIAGLLARRIVCRLHKGDRLLRGQRYGMIKLGSKVDIYLPAEVKLLIKVGDKVFAGKTPLGVMSK
ncbi:MAG: phosphatidylserine decarboxylase family protein, partial [Synergistaceae bacterium]|jgi:phosphatidylserine decarboxylase|nr:phosphatidylserine decarboxylase family protein [Synergistaceae bacterium]